MRLYVDAACPAGERLVLRGALRIDLWWALEAEGSAALADAALIVLGSRDSPGNSSVPLAARLREDLPHVPIYICAEPEDGVEDRLREYAWAGVDEVFVLGSETDWRHLEWTVERRLRVPTLTDVLGELAGEIPLGEGRTVLLWELRSGWRRRGQGEVAKWFGCDIKTVNGKLGAIGYPTTGVVLRYSVLMHAAELEHAAERSPERIATLLGLSNERSRSRKRRTAERQCHAGFPGTERLHRLLESRELAAAIR